MADYKILPGQDDVPARSKQIEGPSVKPVMTVKALQAALKGARKMIAQLEPQIEGFKAKEAEYLAILKSIKSELKIDITAE